MIDYNKISHLAEEYAKITDNRELRARRQEIVSQVANFNTIEALYFAQQAVSWYKGCASMFLTVLTNRIIRIK